MFITFFQCLVWEWQQYWSTTCWLCSLSDMSINLIRGCCWRNVIGKTLSLGMRIKCLWFTSGQKTGHSLFISRSYRDHTDHSLFTLYPFSFGSQRRQSHSSLPVLPFFSLLASFVSSHLLRDSLCMALQTRKLWIWSTGLLVQLTLSSQQEVWVLGNLFVRTGHSQPAIRGMRGRGGKSYVWRLFPWRTLKISTYSVPW